MLNLFKQRKKEFLVSPCNGTIVNLEDVNDKIFAQKLLGDGFAVQPRDEVICAPCSGEITMLADTFHAFAIKTDCGAEILVHVGLDTVNLEGRGFQALAAHYQRVKKGVPILGLDIPFLEKQNLDMTVIIILMNCDDFSIDIQMDAGEVRSSEKIARITKS